MIPIEFENPDVVLKAPPGMEDECGDLHVMRDVGMGYPELVSMWAPSEEERQMIADGGGVELRIVGDVHPPVAVNAIANPAA